MEVLSILLKNPHHHSLPHALPVHFANETYQVVGFDGSSTIAEFLHDLSLELGCRAVDQSGFTIFSDDPLDKDMYHALHLEDKVCDVISKWETALREKGSGKFENKRVIRFVYQNRLFWRKNVVGEVDRERLLFTYQISKQIVQGRFPLSKELAFELTALMAQVRYFFMRPIMNASFWKKLRLNASYLSAPSFKCHRIQMLPCKRILLQTLQRKNSSLSNAPLV